MKKIHWTNDDGDSVLDGAAYIIAAILSLIFAWISGANFIIFGLGLMILLYGIVEIICSIEQ